MSTTERGRDVVDDDRNADGVVDRLEVLVEPFLRRLVVIGRDHQHGVGARLLGMLATIRSPPRSSSSRRRRSPARGPWPGRRTIPPPARAPRATASGFRRWCRPARARWCPSAICQSTRSRNAFSSTDAVLERRDERGERAPKARLGGHDNHLSGQRLAPLIRVKPAWMKAPALAQLRPRFAAPGDRAEPEFAALQGMQPGAEAK